MKTTRSNYLSSLHEEFPSDLLPIVFDYCNHNDFQSMVTFSKLNKTTCALASEHLAHIKCIFEKLHFYRSQLSHHKHHCINKLIECINNENNGLAGKFVENTIEVTNVNLANRHYLFTGERSKRWGLYYSHEHGITITEREDQEENDEYDFTINANYLGHGRIYVRPVGLEINTINTDLFPSQALYLKHGASLTSYKFKKEIENHSKTSLILLILFLGFCVCNIVINIDSIQKTLRK